MGGCFLARWSLEFLFLFYKCWDSHCRYLLHFDMKSIFSSSINKYLSLLGSNQCILRFFYYDPWFSSGANRWKNKEPCHAFKTCFCNGIGRLLGFILLHILSYVECYLESWRFIRSHKEGKKAQGFLYFVFLLSFSELFQFGIEKSTCNCKLKGCLHLFNTLLGFSLNSMSLDPKYSEVSLSLFPI